MKQYVRFGYIPKSGRSLNYLKLTGNQRETISDLISDGRTPEESVSFACENFRDFKGIKPDDLFEDGISVFNATPDGKPIIENRTQAESLANRIGQNIFLLTGEEVGTGQDGEPLISNISGRQILISDEILQDVIIDFLKSTHETMSGEKDHESNQTKIYSFTDFRTNEKETVYMGISFK